jgi:hypothetical protein
MKSYAQLAFNSRYKDITDFIKVVVQKMHKICAKNAFTNKLMLYSVIFFDIYIFITTFALLK